MTLKFEDEEVVGGVWDVMLVLGGVLSGKNESAHVLLVLVLVYDNNASGLVCARSRPS
jgi:hypothetical protein